MLPLLSQLCLPTHSRTRPQLLAQPLLSRSLHSVKAAVLLCLLLLVAVMQPARAQYGPPGGPPAGSWGNPTTTGSGSFDYNYVFYGVPDNVTGQPWSASYQGPLLWVNSDSGLPSHVDSTGTITETRTWSGSTPPTAPVYILESSSATSSGGMYGLKPGSGTAQDAFNDPPVPFSGGVQSSGGKLIQMDGSSGTISLSGTMSASGDTPAGDFSAVASNTAVYSGVNSSFSWNFDSRAVTISASVDVTSKKVPLFDPNGNQTSDVNGDPNYTSAPNLRDLDGTMYGDVGLPTTALGASNPESFSNIPCQCWRKMAGIYLFLFVVFIAQATR